MKLVIIQLLLALLILVAYAADANETSLDDDETEWQNFLQKYRIQNGVFKMQTGYELETRKQLFMDRLHVVREHNNKFQDEKVTWQMGINQFSDYTESELKALTGVKLPEGVNSIEEFFSRLINSSIINDAKEFLKRFKKSAIDSSYRVGTNYVEVDWVRAGAVNPIRSQGSCGSCWAFGAIATWEAAWFRKTGILPQLSEQQLLDCSPHTYGCNGGLVDWAWYDNRYGAMSQESYPYVGYQKPCEFNRNAVTATISSWNHVPFTRFFWYKFENNLMSALRDYGPVSVYMYASSQFVNYRSGVFYDNSYNGQSINHAVVAVGYGSLNDVDYYLVRNSWGTNWGMDGYFMIARNKNGHCGIADFVMFPVV